MNTNTAHVYTAADELDRRALNRSAKRQGLATMRAPETPEGRRLMAMSASALRAEADGRTGATPAPTQARTTARKAPAVALVSALVKGADGRERTPAEARAAAWAWRTAEFHAGRKVTYAAACARFGTTPAKAGK